MQKYTTPENVPSFIIPCIQGHPSKEIVCGEHSAAAFTKTDASGETYVTINVKLDSSKNNEESQKVLGKMMASGFDSIGWMVVANRAGKRGEAAFVKTTDTFANTQLSGTSYSCSQDVTKVTIITDTAGGIENGCKNYACLVNEEIQKMCNSNEETLWKSTQKQFYKLDYELMTNEFGMYRSASKDGKAGSFKLSDQYQMHFGGFACSPGNNCSKVLMGWSSGWFNFSITGAKSLGSGAAIAAGAFALF